MIRCLYTVTLSFYVKVATPNQHISDMKSFAQVHSGLINDVKLIWVSYIAHFLWT